MSTSPSAVHRDGLPQLSIRAIRVLHVTQASGTGVAAHIRHLVGHAGRQTLSGLVVPDDGALARWARERGCRVAVVPMARSIGLHDAVALIRLIVAIRRFRPDILHLHSSKAGALGRVAGWACGAPVRLYTANAFAFLGHTGLKRALLRGLERLGAWFGTGTIAVSPSEAEAARELSRRPVWTVMNAIPLPPGAATAVRALPPDPPQPLIGTIGRISPQKRTLLFVQSMERLADLRDDVRFVILGGSDGWRPQSYEQRVLDAVRRSRHSDRFRVVGWVDKATATLAQFSVLVFTSAFEGLPFGLLEAWQQGVPVVSVNVPGLGDVVRDGVDGLLVRTATPDDVAAAVNSLLKTRHTRERLASEAYRRVVTEHDAAVMAREYERIYADALRSAAHRRPL